MLAMQRKSTIWPYLLVAPALAVVLAVVFVPGAQRHRDELPELRPAAAEQHRLYRLKNYAAVLADPLFWRATLKTILWVGFGVGLQFVFGFALALLLNQDFVGRGIVRSISLIPWVTPGVLIGLMWRWIFDGNYGVLNDFLLKLGLIHDKVPFLAQESTAFPAVILTIVWQGIPFFAIMLLAGSRAFPTSCTTPPTSTARAACSASSASRFPRSRASSSSPPCCA